MADQPTPPQTGIPPMESENFQDYAGALRTIASARSLFLLLLLLSLLTHLGLYSVARWKPDLVGLAAAADPPPEQTTAADDDTNPAAAESLTMYESDAARPPGQVSPKSWPAAEAILPLSAIVGLASGILLILCYLLSVNVALCGRLGGVRGSLSALMWMAVVVLLLLPWEGWLGGWGIHLPGAYLTVDEVLSVSAPLADRTAEVIHNVRFLGYPLLVLVIAVVGDRRYARGYRLAGRQIEARLAVRRV